MGTFSTDWGHCCSAMVGLSSAEAPMVSSVGRAASWVGAAPVVKEMDRSFSSRVFSL